MLFTKKSFSGIFLVALTAITFFSCQKELSNESGGTAPGTTAADLTTKATSSVSGFVTNENNAAVLGAAVKFGSATTTTDKFGYFEFSNIEVIKNAAFVTVSKPGYFNGIKTYIAETGKSAFFRIKLMPKTNAGSINAGTGGSVTTATGLIVALPANAVVNAGTGAAYSGSVNVAARWIDPTAADLNETMPGDLRAIDAAGSLKGLTTYGMAAVELTGAAGELLQIASGKKATLTWPLPASVQATAPATIQLWSFDETIGLWKEEGTAVRTGNTYVGEVSHFSFWNCDVPDDYIWLQMTLVNSAGAVLPNTRVKITEVSNPANYRYGYTNAQGYVTGQVPSNAQLLMEVLSSNICSTTTYSQTITTTNTTLSLGNVIIPSTTASTATVSGVVVDCSNNPVSSGRVIVYLNNLYYVYYTSNTGAFSFNLLLCGSSPVAISLVPEDLATQQQGIPINYTVIAGTNNIGNMQACGTSVQQFMNFTINSANYSFGPSADTVYHSVNTQVIPLASTVSAYGIGTGFPPTPSLNAATIQFAQQNIALNSVQNLLKFTSNAISPDSLSIAAPIGVNITEYGAIGQFISGNFTGSFTGKPPANTSYNITCSFRVKRRI